MEEVLNTHVKEYRIKCLACLAEMQKVWQDLEVSESARQIEVSNAIAEACGAWSNALTRCAHQRAEVAAQIFTLLDQAGMIAEELGEGNSTGSKVRRHSETGTAENSSASETCCGARECLLVQQEAMSGALMARKVGAEMELADWKERRAMRLCQVEELQV